MSVRKIMRPLLALFLFASISCAGEEAITLRILSYNIHHGEGVDGKLDLERVAHVIRSAHPDLVALQEVDQSAKRSGGVNQLAKLGDLTGMHIAFGKAMDFQNGAYGVGMLSKWPLQETQTHALPVTPGVEPRAVLAAIVPIGKSAKKLQFLVTHVDHRADPKERTLQIGRLRELFPPKPNSGPAILAGDFNAVPDSEVVQSLLSDWRDSAIGNNFLTSPSNLPRRKIDYILFRPASGWRVIETRALDEAVASDHRPVLAVMELL